MKNIFFNRFLIYIFAVAVIVLFISGLLACSIAVKQHRSSVARQKNFMLNFTKELCLKYTEKNVVVSPAALHTALSLVYLGAKSETANEMADFLGFQSKTREQREVLQSYVLSFGALPWRKGTEFRIANRIFVDRKYEPLQEFNKQAANYLHTIAEKVDFKEPILAADIINSWIASKLKQATQNIVSVEAIVAVDEPFVLVNAIAFEAYWEHHFTVDHTFSENFYLSLDMKVAVDMMHTEGYFKYADLVEWNAAALEIPLVHSDIFMLIMLPKSIDGLQTLERKLNETDFESFSKLNKNFKVQKVKLRLPKFSLEFNSSLKEILKEMGLKTIFDKPDFSGLLDSNLSLPLSDVIHKTSIIIDEIGIGSTKASGVTSNEHHKNRPFNAKDAAYELNVNHPFLFIIKDSDTIYFAGHVTSL